MFKLTINFRQAFFKAFIVTVPVLLMQACSDSDIGKRLANSFDTPLDQITTKEEKNIQEASTSRGSRKGTVNKSEPLSVTLIASEASTPQSPNCITAII